ncbi:MAG: hypothetical protein M3245_05300, partial [Actinomycetota bacterium]|nr:hypothetical protein [Actinomycetota bacterium]
SAQKAWSFTTWRSVFRYPFATRIETGAYRSGSHSRLAADDNLHYEVRSTTSGTRTSSWYGRFSGVTNALKSLRVAYRGRNSLSCGQTVSIWRWTTNSWVQLDSRSVGATEVLVDKTVDGAPADYVSGTTGDGEVRVRVRCTKRSAFYSRGDLMKVTFTRP